MGLLLFLILLQFVEAILDSHFLLLTLQVVVSKNVADDVVAFVETRFLASFFLETALFLAFLALVYPGR